MDSERQMTDQEIAGKVVVGIPRALLTCRQNSHPFQERVLNLDQPVKIGRSVARTRSTASNGIFDCKVLSRNHAVMWYENERFYIQDTKSSNGTFVNSQRLSRGAEDSPPRELWSDDILQFGVDVLENQRKGNEDSDSCDDSVHIVTHGCIVATVKLIYPNGKEAKSSSTNTAQSAVPQEDFYQLQMLLFEMQQKEDQLTRKLEEMEVATKAMQEASRVALHQRFEESRLLSKIETLEKRIKVMNKLKTGETTESDMVSQLLNDIEKVQKASREIQETLREQLLTAEYSLTVAVREANNFQLEVQALKDSCKLNEAKVQEFATICSGYLSTIENLESTLKAQKKQNMDLEMKVEGFQLREEILQKLLANPIGKALYEHLFASDEYDDLRPPRPNDDKMQKDDDKTDVNVWYDKFLPALKDRVNEEDTWMLIKRLLENIFVAMDHSRKEYDGLALKKQALISKLDAARLLHHPNVKTENYSDDENGGGDKANQGVTKNNESVTVLEKELKETEDHLWEALRRRKRFEARCRNMKLDLDTAAVPHSDKCEIMEEKTDSDHQEAFTVDHLRQIVENFSSETEKSDSNYEKFILPKEAFESYSTNPPVVVGVQKQDEGTQTDKALTASKETSMDMLTDPHDRPPEVTSDATVRSSITVTRHPAIYYKMEGDSDDEGTLTGITPVREQTESEYDASSETDSSVDSFTTTITSHGQKAVFISYTEDFGSDEPNVSVPPGDERHSSREEENKRSKRERIVRFDVPTSDSEPDTASLVDSELHAEVPVLDGCVSDRDARTLWEKFREFYTFCDESLPGVQRDEERSRAAKHMLHALSDDLVSLLVRDSLREEERRQLQERLDSDLASMTFADRFIALIIGVVVCFVGSYLLESFGH